MTSGFSYVHRFVPGSAVVRPLLLLHGTGGDETDLLPLGELLAPGAPLVSPRGDVSENGMPRFFRRLSEGVFDEADVTRAADKLAGFVGQVRRSYEVPAPVAVGFSNGANVAAALLLTAPGILAGAVLLRAMRPFRTPPEVALGGTPVLIVSGVADPIVPADNAAGLAADLELAGAAVTHETIPASHGLTQRDVALAAAWLEGHAGAAQTMAAAR